MCEDRGALVWAWGWAGREGGDGGDLVEEEEEEPASEHDSCQVMLSCPPSRGHNHQLSVLSRKKIIITIPTAERFQVS